MRKRKRPNWALRLCLAGILAFFVVYVLVIPVCGLAFESAPTSEYEQSLQVNRFFSSLLNNATEFAIGFWFLFLGTAIGSFLNVVVYRMPIGKSIAAKGSYCPHCRVSIRSYDNIPVLGWIKLRGRCRACRLPIASRYPIVEAFVGGLFLLLYLVEVSSGGANLPGIQNASGYGISSVLLGSRYDVLAQFIFHAILISTLVSASLIRYDGAAFPMRLAMFGVISALAMAVAWPEVWLYGLRTRITTADPIVTLFPVDAFIYESMGVLNRFSIQAAVTWGFGVVVGLGMGWSFGALVQVGGGTDPDRQSPRRSLLFGLAVIGAFLGWQSVLSVLALTVVGGLVLGGLGAIFDLTRRVPMLAWVSGAAFLHILLWKFFVAIRWWPGSSIEWQWLVPQLIVLALGVVLLGRLHQWQPRSKEVSPRATIQP